MTELEYKETWRDYHKGVQFEVLHWRLGWNYYLFIPCDQLPDELKPVFNLKSHTYKIADDGNENIAYDYCSKPIISDLDWHCGITLYEKARDDRGKVVGYRLGCDYMHYWDEDKQYDLEYVIAEAKHSIDKLWEHIPNLKLRCAWNGRFYSQDEVFYTDKGVCVALENKEKWYKPIG